MKLLALSIASLIVMALSLLITVRIEFYYRRQHQKDFLEINLRALSGLLKFTMKVPGIELTWEKTPALEFQQKTQSINKAEVSKKHRLRPRLFNPAIIFTVWPRISILLQRLNEVKKRFYQGIECTALKWHIEYGGKDSASTAVMVGMFWAILGYSLARLHKLVTVKVSHPQIAVIPQFEKEGFVCDFYCIFQMRIGHIMVAGFNLLRVFQQGKRGQVYG